MKKSIALLLAVILLFGCAGVSAAENEGLTVSASQASGDVAAPGYIQLTSQEGADIYYTVDGSDPSSSETALLFSPEYGIIVTEDITVKASAFDGKKWGEVQTFEYKCSSPLLPEDNFFAETSRGIWIENDTEVKKSGESAVRIDGNITNAYMAQPVTADTRFDYTLEFWIKTEELTVVDELDAAVADSAYVSVLLAGGAQYDRHDNGTGGIFFGEEERLVEIKTDQDWTHYEIPITDLNGVYDSLLITAGLKNDVGRMWIDGMKLTAKQKNNYPASVSSDGKVYGNNYYEDISSNFVINQGFLLNNSALNTESGTLSYKVTNDKAPDTVIGEGSLKAKVNAGEEKAFGISLPEIDSYGTYTVEFTMSSSLTGKSYPAGELHIARAVDSSDINSGSMFGVAIDPNISDCSVFSGAGIGTVRFDLDWEKVEAEQDVFSIPEKIESTVDTCVQNGIDPLVILNSHGWPEWYEYGEETKTGFPVTEAQIAQFVEYAEYVVGHFKGRVTYYELFNETNGVFNITSAENYVRLMKAVYPAIKAIDPDAKLIAGVMASVAPKDGTDNNFCEGMFENGAADYMDIFSFHPYVRPNSPESVDWAEQIEGMHEIMRRYTDKDIPFWFTELGYSTDRTPRGVTVEKQKDYLVRTFAWAKSLGYVERISVYREESHNYPYDFEICFGVFSGRGAKVGTLNPSGAALSCFVKKTKDMTFDSSISLADGLYVHKYTGQDKDMYLLWTDDPEYYAEITTSDKSAELFDIYGNPIAAEYHGKTFCAGVSGEIMYMTLEKGEEIKEIILSKTAPQKSGTAWALLIAVFASVLALAAVTVITVKRRKRS